ncbi:MAG: transcriptional regulator [Akkermansia sp.]
MSNTQEALTEINARIKQLGLSQLELSRIVGAGPSNISRILHGKEKLTEKMANRLRDALGISTNSDEAIKSILSGKSTQYILSRWAAERGCTVNELMTECIKVALEMASLSNPQTPTSSTDQADKQSPTQ